MAWMLIWFWYIICMVIQQKYTLEHLQEFVKIYLANPVFCQLLKSYAKQKRIHLQQFVIIQLSNPDLTYIRNPERNKIMHVPFHLLKKESFSILYFFFTLPHRGKQRWQPRSVGR
jgi:hypothetical protein